MSEKMVSKASSFIANRSSRRGFLARAAIVGSAIAVGPLRYLVYPESAEAIVQPGDCGGSTLCGAGFSEFCCSINYGENACPNFAYVAGWWKCTDYNGSKVCSNAGVRYYIDCNRRPNYACPNGCFCGQNRCGCRRTCCTHFRYGQCHTNVDQLTNVVCRIVRCIHPATVDGYECNNTYAQDNTTCTHEACCDCGGCN